MWPTAMRREGNLGFETRLCITFSIGIFGRIVQMGREGVPVHHQLDYEGGPRTESHP